MTENRGEFPVQSHLLWRQAWLSLWENRTQISIFLLAFIIMPQLLSESLLASRFDAELTRLTALSTANQLTIVDLLEAFRQGASHIIVTVLATLLLLAVGYISVLQTCVSYFESQPAKPFAEQLRAAIPAVPKTFLVMIILFVFFGMVQAVLPPLILVFVPLIMAPTLYIIERNGAWRAIRESLTLRFIAGSEMPKISVYFILLGYLGFIILSLYLALIVGEYTLNLDTIFKGMFGAANSSLPSLPFSLLYVAFEVFFILVMTVAFAYFISLTASFYFYVKQRKQRLPPEGIQA